MKRKEYETVRTGIEAYFTSRRKALRGQDGQVLTDKNGTVLYEERAATASGLAYYLGFSSREEMLSIRDKKTKALLDRALLRIEATAEEKLFCKDTFQGAKLFLAVNFSRWRGKEEEMPGEGESLGKFTLWAE